MSVIIQTRGEVGGGVAAHLQCPTCGHYSKSHSHQLSHMATFHPSCLDDVAVGRLGNILIYQSTAQLFHCSSCFYTTRDFTKLYKHIITKHCVDETERGGGEGGDDGSDREEKEKTGGEGVGEEEEEKEGESLKRKRSSEAEEEDEGEGNDEDGASQRMESVTPDAGGEGVLALDSAGYRCLICGWTNKLKALGVNHVVRKHEIPKTYASQAIRRDATVARQTQSSVAEDDEMAGLSGELLKEEMEATAKVIRFVSNRFVCLTCGWKTKLKGFAISHVVRYHNVEHPYSCKECKRSFFLFSHLQQHIGAAHRPGRYACPFCCFRSHFLGGFRRHCSRCNAREKKEVGGGGAEDVEEKEARAGRRRGRAERMIEEVEEHSEDGVFVDDDE
ncbi:chromosome alignment-maintaining phosphoprotein 1-like [Anabas testudineus]|uniref:C2H2-type domain-containing protein n=1 Tax=Anabas testudineus TaxID=64144 RepID=A0A7N6BBM5_ANATE|nr:chromosome alignment-maintaining phosphoprotein 1-like [Anabas testudineus]